MALISQNWTRGLLKESGRLTGVQSGCFCVTETNKRQIQGEKSDQPDRQTEDVVGGGLENNQRGEAVGEKSHRGTERGRGGERSGGGRGKKISVGLESREVNSGGDGMESLKELRQERAEKIHKGRGTQVQRRRRHKTYPHFYNHSAKVSIKASELESRLFKSFPTAVKIKSSLFPHHCQCKY